MNPAKGIAFKLISAGLFAVMSALIRHLGARYPIGQVVFYRSVFAIIPVVLVYAWRGELAAVVRTERPRQGCAEHCRNVLQFRCGGAPAAGRVQCDCV
jgi:hypothetical protein